MKYNLKISISIFEIWQKNESIESETTFSQKKKKQAQEFDILFNL